IIRDANPQLQQVITVNESLNSFLTTMTGTPSAEQTYTVEGTSLTSALTITASADFEVSLTSGTGFGSSVVIPSSSANAGAVTIYVRYNPAAGTSHNGTLTHASTGATDVVINIDGSLPASITPIATARGLSAGTQVTITGQLTVAGEFDRNIYVQDATGGIALFDASRDIANGGFSIGDSVLLTGEVGAFRTEIQLSALTDIFNLGVATVPFQPETITFTALSTSASDYLGELVRVANPSFPNPGDIIYGEGVIELSDGATGNIFIDGDVTSLVAKAQPASCSEVIGVLAIFDGVPQIKPRLEADLACLDDYVSQASTQTACISASNTLEIVTWNIEWFGHPSNSPAGSDPNAEAIQIDSVRNAILQMDADLYAFQEISDLNAFATLVAQLPGYAYVASPAVSGGPPVTQDEDQQLVFLYRTSVINPISSKALFETVHPLYNGGDDSQLTGYPVTDRSRFFASGRLPFMMTADVTINGVTDQYRFVNLHGRANNSGSPQERYDMRRYDVTALEDTLSTQYGTDKLIMLGDYNDDVDETVADIVSTTTSYDAYTTSPAEYDIVTDELSAAGFRSTVGFENMIDHIMVTNEIQSNYIPNSAQVYLEFFSSTYSSTTSDHFPVGIRMEVQAVPACDFTATASGTTEINLSWTDVSNIETEYVLEFSTDNTNWFTVPMSPLAADANSYTHTGLMSGTLYYYRLKAVATTGTNESEYVLTQAATGGAMIPEISLVVSPTQVTEDADLLTMRFTFTSTVAPASDLTIRFSVGGNAVYNDDYYLINPMGVTFSANSGTIVLPAGQTSVDLILQAQQDAIQEGDETIVITIQP
ncbi:MAG: endonuclease/exonuclease/phosphatase family protein, partial [Bacteroidota bacterium]